MALGSPDGSARPAQGQQYGCLGGLFPLLGLLCTDHCVPEQSRWSQAASGVCTSPLSGKVRLDCGLGPLRLGPGQRKATVVVPELICEPRPLTLRQTDLWSSVEMQTSTMSEPNGRMGGNMTCDRPLRELTGVPDDREEAEEVESEPWEEDF